MEVSRLLLEKITELLALKNMELGNLNSLTADFNENMKTQFNSKEIQNNLHHPVHIIDTNNNLSPSAFIPFCEFGGNMSLLGQKIEQFQVPVCSSFRKTFLNGKTCYSIDINEIMRERNIKMDKKLLEDGLVVLMDFNEERSTITNQSVFENNKISLTNMMTNENKFQNGASIYFGTLSKHILSL